MHVQQVSSGRLHGLIVTPVLTWNKVDIKREHRTCFVRRGSQLVDQCKKKKEKDEQAGRMPRLKRFSDWAWADLASASKE